MKKKRKEKKENSKEKGRKIAMGKEGFPGSGPTLLAVHWVAVVRCN
jgi:hypothetical protein